MKLIFTHIPKAAGSSFTNILHQVYGRDEVLDIWRSLGFLHKLRKSGFEWYTDRDAFIEKCQPRIKELSVGKSVMVGHLPAAVLRGMFPEAFRVTFIRRAVDRYVSFFVYSKQHGLTTCKSAADMTSDKITLNWMSMMTLGSNFDFIGKVESFNEDVLDLKDMLGWPDVTVPHINRTSYYPVSPDDYSRIAMANYKDVEMYRMLT